MVVLYEAQDCKEDKEVILIKRVACNHNLKQVKLNQKDNIIEKLCINDRQAIEKRNRIKNPLKICKQFDTKYR